MNTKQEDLLQLIYENQLIMMDVALTESSLPLRADRVHIFAQLVIAGRISFEAAVARMSHISNAEGVLLNSVAALRGRTGRTG